MYKLIFQLFLLSTIFLYTNCQPTSHTETHSQSTIFKKDSVYNTQYTTRFSFSRLNGYRAIHVFGNKDNHDTTATYVLYPSSDKRPTIKGNVFCVPIPVTTVACMGSLYTSLLKKLGVQDKIVAIDNVDYYTDSFIINKVTSGNIQELSKGPEINVEQTLALNPSLILTFGMGNPKQDMNDKIVQAGIPIVVSIDHLETTPLARAEWIKFFAAFFDKDQLADSLFKVTEKNYTSLKQLIDTITYKPSVFTEIKFGDTWYVPGGKSYMSQLLTDAGTQYIWKDNSSTGSVPLSFEQVYEKAKEADYWLNVYNCNTLTELLKYDERYGFFKAVKNKNVYNNNKLQNSKGYTAYWETGISNPDELLHDFIGIFHPNVLPQSSLKYYKKIIN